MSFQAAVAPGQAEQGMQYGALLRASASCFIAYLLVPALASLYEHAELDPLFCELVLVSGQQKSKLRQ